MSKKSTSSSHRAQSPAVDTVTAGDAVLISVSGQIDERFAGFGELGQGKALILDVSSMQRLTSFGVRKWLDAVTAVPKSFADVYLVGCPTFFVDQLNMVLNFGGAAKVLTVVAPYLCKGCGVESGELIDLVTERSNLAKGIAPTKTCSRCSAELELDETPESYFAFAPKYAAVTVHAAAAQLLAERGLYQSSEVATDKPPKLTKLVHGKVTYFRISGTIAASFRARPVLVGAEGELVLDLGDLERFDVEGQKEWRKLLKGLSTQATSITIVDAGESFLTQAGDSLTIARNIALASVLLPYRCADCGRSSRESVNVIGSPWPLDLPDRVCATCGGRNENQLPPAVLAPLQKASTSPPSASVKLFEQRVEILSRAMTDAKVAQAGDMATAEMGDDTLLAKYKIVRRLSEGGMAEVFLAKQLGMDKPVALKRIQRKLLESRQLAVDMFLNEAKIAGRLTHPNIVQVLDVGEVGGALYLAMEYVRGKDLRAIVRKLAQHKVAMSVAHACYIVQQIAVALHHAYWSTDLDGKQLAVVHRDISPHNVIISYDGGVKLLDFGVAMSAVTEYDSKLVVGKWQYIPPEATLGEPIDHRSDLFSLGVILYQLVSGVMPFSGNDPKTIVAKIREGNYALLSEVAPHAPKRLAWLVSRMLSSRPENRPQRGQDVANELAEIARDEGIESSPAETARFLRELFPGEGDRDTPVKDIVRAYPDADGDLTIRDRSPISFTGSRALGPVDVSETFRVSSQMPAQLPPELRRRSASFSPPVRTTGQLAAQPAAPIAPPTAAVVRPSTPQRSRGPWTVLILLVAAAAIAGVAYALGYLG